MATGVSKVVEVVYNKSGLNEGEMIYMAFVSGSVLKC